MVPVLCHSQEWKFVQHAVFDHRVHEYTLDEVAERLESHGDRQVHYEQGYPGFRTTMRRVLVKEGTAYALRHPRAGGAYVNLSEQLTAAHEPLAFCATQRLNIYL